VVLVSDPTVAAYNPLTGQEIWSVSGMSGEVGPSACYDNGIVYAMNEYATLLAIKAGETPEILWDDWEYLSDVPSPVVKNDLLFVPTSYGVLACYNATEGGLIWEKEFDRGFYSSPMIVGDQIYLMERNGMMHIIGIGKEFVSIAQNPLGEKSVTTPAFADGNIYIRSDDNNLYCIGN
jgi:outer membrane protein assembly factor BamB